MITYQCTEGLPDDTLKEHIFHVHHSVFGSLDQDRMLNEIKNKHRLTLHLVWHEEQLIGYKMGYQLKQEIFYSWLGGVLPKYRQQGIASRLMEEQHQWCIKNGYSCIQTKTMNKWKAMLILNLKHGFDIIGTYTTERGPKIILEKSLTKSY